MINSMTGFGDAEAKTSRFTATFQLNSVNNRFLDIKFNAGRVLGTSEPEFAAVLRKHVHRGKVEIFLDLSFDASATQLHMDDNAVKSLLSETRRIARKFKIRNGITMSDIISVKNVFTPSEARITEKDIPALKKAFEQAVRKLAEMRKREGKHLEDDINSHIIEIERQLEMITRDQARLEDNYRTKLLERATAMKEEFQMDSNRLLSEVAILMGKSDISEELARLKSHLSQFRTFLEETGPVGRKLDFLSQELLREVNTIGSKISDEKVTGSVVRIKDYLEKIREQVQNIE